MEHNQFMENYLSNKTLMYLSHSLIPEDNTTDFPLRNISLYRIDEVCFDDKAPRKEALENVMASLNMKGINFIFLIIGDEDKVNFYYGLSSDTSSVESEDINIYEIGNTIFKPSILGNFRGSKVTEMSAYQNKNIIQTIRNRKYNRIIEGVPGVNDKKDKKFQGIDRLVNVMYGSEYCLMIIAKPLDLDTILYLQEKLYDLYTTKLSPLAKTSIQTSYGTNEGVSKTDGKSETISNSSSDTTSDGSSTSETHGTSRSETKGTNDSTAVGESHSKSSSSSKGTSESSSQGKYSTSSTGGTSHTDGNSTTNTTGTSFSSTTGNSYSKTDGTTKSSSHTSGYSHSDTDSSSHTSSSGNSSSSSTTTEVNNKAVQEWIKYLDDILLSRLDYGKGKGLFLSSIAVFAGELSPT